MKASLVHQVEKNLEKEGVSLIIIASPVKSDMACALQEMHAKHGWPLVNLNLALSERFLELSVKQRALRVATIVGDILQEASEKVVLIDNIELLFHPDLKQDPGKLLEMLSRNYTIVVAWPGTYSNKTLGYAIPSHSEYYRVEKPQTSVVCVP